jgi:hypothetical protein
MVGSHTSLCHNIGQDDRQLPILRMGQPTDPNGLAAEVVQTAYDLAVR